MNEFINELYRFSDVGAVVTVAHLSVSLTLAFLLSIAVAKTYQTTYRGVSYSPAFMHTLVICAMVVAAVMLIIGSNIARAFSLVGALSIIRFRNAVKDPRDVAYIFLAMGVGMGCGTQFYKVAVTLTVLACLFILTMHWTKFGEQGLIERVLRIRTQPVEGFEKKFSDALKSLCKEVALLTAERTRLGSELSLSFVVRVSEKTSAESLMKAVSAVDSQASVEIVGSNHVLDL